MVIGCRTAGTRILLMQIEWGNTMISAPLPRTGRIMMCSNEVVGLGHLRRTLTLAEYLREHTSLTSQLIITGSPVAQNFPLPQGADYIKLPSASKQATGEYTSRSMPMPFRELRAMRRDIVLSAGRHFRP